MNLFPDPSDRVRAWGIYGVVSAAGSGIGELLGGTITQGLGWHWIFLINLPIGLLVYITCVVLLPRDEVSTGPRNLNIPGAVLGTTALTLLTYGLVGSSGADWTRGDAAGVFGMAAAFFLLFFLNERYARTPLLNLRLFEVRNFAVANIVGVLWAGGTFAWYVISALYLQTVRGYDPLHVGLSFLPGDVIMATFSAGLAAKIVERFGIRAPLCVGLFLAAFGLALFARAPSGGTFAVDVLPGMVLVGLGAGMAYSPWLSAAMTDTGGEESGAASGIVNTTFTMGGTLGLAMLAKLAAVRTEVLQQSGADGAVALLGGYQLAFLISALVTASGAVVGAFGLRTR